MAGLTETVLIFVTTVPLILISEVIQDYSIPQPLPSGTSKQLQKRFNRSLLFTSLGMQGTANHRPAVVQAVRWEGELEIIIKVDENQRVEVAIDHSNLSNGVVWGVSFLWHSLANK